MEGKMGLRMPKDSFLPCLFCNRKFLRAEAHWTCSKCRETIEKANCPEDCEACEAMICDEWRKKALEQAEYKKNMYYKNHKRSKYIHFGSRKSCAKGKVKFFSKRKTASKPKIKSSEENSDPLVPDEAPSSSKKIPLTPYTQRLKNFEEFLFEELNPQIPDSLVEEGFALPKVPTQLRHKFEVTKCELVRLLASSSICYHLSKNRTQFCDENNQIFNASSDGIVSLFASLIKHKANTLGKVIFEIRENLLENVFCADPQIIPLMIRGPIAPKESFFGNINLLKEAVELDENNVLRMAKYDVDDEEMDYMPEEEEGYLIVD